MDGALSLCFYFGVREEHGAYPFVHIIPQYAGKEGIANIRVADAPYDKKGRMQAAGWELYG